MGRNCNSSCAEVKVLIRGLGGTKGKTRCRQSGMFAGNSGIRVQGETLESQIHTLQAFPAFSICWTALPKVIQFLIEIEIEIHFQDGGSALSVLRPGGDIAGRG
jgi:hypothetical protein